MGAYNELLTLMGMNPNQRKDYEDAYGDMDTSRRKRANTYSPGPTGNKFSWFENPGGLPDFAKENARKKSQNSAFFAATGMILDDAMESYRLSKIQEGTFDSYGNKVKEGTTEPSTQGVGFGFNLDKGMPAVPDMGFSVGQRFDRQGNPITETPAQTIKFTPEQKRLKDMYAEMRKRLEMSALQKTAGSSDKDTAIRDLTTTYKHLFEAGASPDSPELTAIKNRLLSLQNIQVGDGSPLPEETPENAGMGWRDYLKILGLPTAAYKSVNKSLTTPMKKDNVQFKRKDPLNLGI